jgi:hypothetical protein
MRKQASIPRKRNRVVMVLLLPVVAILWLMGWSLCWVGFRKQLVKSAKSKRHEGEDLTFTVLMPEQKHVK